MGLLDQPHTSAGRVPTQMGYRVYIDTLMKKKPVTREEKRYLDSQLLSSAYDPEKLLDGVSRVMAAATRFAAVSTTPSGRGANIPRDPIRADQPPHRDGHPDDLSRDHEDARVPLRL